MVSVDWHKFKLLERKGTLVAVALLLVVGLGPHRSWSCSEISCQKESSLDLSPKLRKFIQRVEKETGRPVRIEPSSKMGPLRVDALFDPNSAYIRVLLRDTLGASDPEAEPLIAHEVTHGLLVFAKGFVVIRERETSTPIERASARLLQAAISDIPVHKLLEREGFAIFATTYLDNVRAEIEAAERGINIYRKVMDSELLGSRYAVMRYILAWSFLEYFVLPTEARALLESFLAIFEKSYEQEAKTGAAFKRVLRRHNVFTASGYREAVIELLKLWVLEDATELVTRVG